MFEKEAEEYTKERAKELGIDDCCLAYHAMQRAYRYGAEFGYNKANEWHYVKDGLPQRFHQVLIWLKKEKRFTRLTMATRVKKNLWTSLIGDFGTKEIIAWKEIVLPELKESE